MSTTGAKLQLGEQFNTLCIEFLNDKLAQSEVDIIFLEQTIGSFKSLHEPVMQLKGILPKVKMDDAFEQFKPYLQQLICALTESQEILSRAKNHKVVISSHQVIQHFVNKTPFDLKKCVFGSLHVCLVPKEDEKLEQLDTTSNEELFIKLTQDECRVIKGDVGMIEVFVYMQDTELYTLGVAKDDVDEIILNMGLEPALFKLEKQNETENLRQKVEAFQFEEKTMDDEEDGGPKKSKPSSGFIPYYDEMFSKNCDLRRSMCSSTPKNEKTTIEKDAFCTIM